MKRFAQTIDDVATRNEYFKKADDMYWQAYELIDVEKIRQGFLQAAGMRENSHGKQP